MATFEVEYRRERDGATTIVARGSEGTVTLMVGDMKVVAGCTDIPAPGATTTTARRSLRGIVDLAALAKHSIDVAEALRRWGFL